MAVEVAGGISFANSLAILTDAAYLLSDIAGFAISLLAIWVAGWEATTNQSFGFYWLEILSLLVPIQLVWLLTVLAEGKQCNDNLRFVREQQQMETTGAASRQQGAYLHVLGDLIQSVGVMIASAMIWYNPKWQILDLICRVLFSVLVLGPTIQMLCNILEVLIESTPQEIDDPTFESGSLGFPGVVVVHELHFWAITISRSLLACHILVAPHVDRLL
ncbi:unnamed protein product [Sphagnum troendelagicum]|uniref:Cation efflux protein transmembrane domain-containing protein n=1 Tax=Sphagnum troendelagicum TaxID=128251 RepID=A0ABP0UKT7_9BRYO